MFQLQEVITSFSEALGCEQTLVQSYVSRCKESSFNHNKILYVAPQTPKFYFIPLLSTSTQYKHYTQNREQ